MTLFDTPSVRRETVIALTATLVVAAPWLLGWATALERPVWDLMMRLPRPGEAPDADMAAVVIDDRSLETLGPLPWPRSRIAAVMKRIRAAGARAVVVDMLLSDSRDRTGDVELEQALGAGPVAAAAVLGPDGTWVLPAASFGGVDIAAHAHAEVASDGVLRYVSTTKQANGISLPALSIVAAGFAGWPGAIRPGEVVRSDFRTPPHTILQLSAADVFDGTADLALLDARVVFLGVTASGAGDQFVVPVGDHHRPVPGVLVHASFASSIVHGGTVSELPWWAMLFVFFTAGLVIQLWRSRAAALHLSSLAIVLIAVPLASIASLWFAHFLVPTVGMLATAATSVFLREATETRAAQREADEILRSLVHDGFSRSDHEIPRGIQGRLHLAHTLQTQLIRDSGLRKTLLEGLHEGVVLWDEGGAPLLHNAATERLWGHVPAYDEVDAEAADHEEDLEIDRHGRILTVARRPIGTGKLALIRDVTESRELDRRRRESQRLVSHELKTPLASIAGFGEMLERYQLTGDELARTAGMIRSEAERLGTMVKRFLDLERLGADTRDQERTVLDLSALVAGRCEVLTAGADRRNIGITLNAPEPVPLTGIPQLLEELVDNLVGNALKYSPERSQVTVVVRSNGDDAIFEVADHGPGIPEDAVEHLFERFFRVPGSSAPGTGLGLALVKEVARLHRASVSVDTEVGRGSVFTVSFPRLEA